MPLPTAPFDAAKSIATGFAVIQLKLLPSITGVTAATDTLTKTSHGLAVGKQLTFNSGTGFEGLTPGTGYFVVAVPSADTFKIAATPTGEAIAVGTSSSGSFTPVSVFESKKLGHKDNRVFSKIDRPDAKGALRPARKWVKEGAESFVFEVDELKRVPAELFDGALSGIKEGTCTIWKPDPDDASGKVALKSDTDFKCDITRDGDLNFEDVNTASISINSRKAGDVQFTPDATA